jgi:HSP20 family protein
MFWTLNERGYDPFGSVRNLQGEMNRIFSTYGGNKDTFPSVNFWSNQDQIVVTAALPGMKPEEIDISVIQGQLSISGEMKIASPSDDMKCHRQERTGGKFTRVFRLPFDVDNKKVVAKYSDGILNITLPRLE